MNENSVIWHYTDNYFVVIGVPLGAKKIPKYCEGEFEAGRPAIEFRGPLPTDYCFGITDATPEAFIEFLNFVRYHNKKHAASFSVSFLKAVAKVMDTRFGIDEKKLLESFQNCDLPEDRVFNFCFAAAAELKDQACTSPLGVNITRLSSKPLVTGITHYSGWGSLPPSDIRHELPSQVREKKTSQFEFKKRRFKKRD